MHEREKELTQREEQARREFERLDGEVRRLAYPVQTRVPRGPFINDSPGPFNEAVDERDKANEQWKQAIRELYELRGRGVRAAE